MSACVKKYENNLMGKTILFVCTDKRKQVSVLEVTFERSNFLHLTGIKPTAGISAKDFYERCLDSRLKESDFAFAEDGTTFMKLEMLPFLVEEDLSVKMVGEYSASNIKLYTTKLAGNVKGCIGFVKKRAGKNYVPNTVLKVDIRRMVREPLRVIMTYKKDVKEQTYKDIVYCAKNVQWEELVWPPEIKTLIPDSQAHPH